MLYVKSLYTTQVLIFFFVCQKKSLYFIFKYILLDWQLISFFFLNLWWILSYIEMKQPWVYMCSPSQSPLPPPSPPAPSRFSSAPGPSACLMHPTWAGDLFHPR